jgi:hypothetical protein
LKKKISQKKNMLVIKAKSSCNFGIFNWSDHWFLPRYAFSIGIVQNYFYFFPKLLGTCQKQVIKTLKAALD